MKISDYIEASEYYSGQVSSLVRQLALAGIAIVWIFKTSIDGDNAIPLFLQLPIILLILTLFLELIQYLTGAIMWRQFVGHHEEKRSSIEDDPDIESPLWMSATIDVIFVLKVIAIITAYFYIGLFLIDKTNFI